VLHPISIKPHISDFLQSHSDMWGSKIVFLLLSKPDEPIHVIRLSHTIDPPSYPTWQFDRFRRTFENNCGIPQTDKQTLRDIDKRLIKLIAIKAELMVNELDFAEIETEMQTLIEYRKETTKPNGRIKSFRLETQKEVKRHRISFQRLLDKALVECPEAYCFFKKHVQTGTYYKWLSFPDEEDAPMQCQEKKRPKNQPKAVLKSTGGVDVI